MSVLKVNQIQTANGVIMANLNSSGANIGFQLASSLAPAFGAFKSSTQSITTGTWTKATLDTEEFDTNNNFSSSRFTPTVAGYYQINGAIYGISSAALTRILIAIYKNGSQFKNGNYIAPITADSLRGQAVVSSLIYLNGSSDYVELYGYLTSSSAPSFEGDASGIQVYMNGFLARSA